jgi:hypothetical protein
MMNIDVGDNIWQDAVEHGGSVNPSKDELETINPFRQSPGRMNLAAKLLTICMMTSQVVFVCSGRLQCMKMRVLKLILNILTPGLPLNEPNVTELQKPVSKTYWPFDNIEQWMLAKALTGCTDSIITVTTWLDVMPYYEELWLNIWIDNHLYKTIG